MNFLQILNDPNLQKFLNSFGSNISVVVLGWLINQLPALQNGSQFWLKVKVTVEVLVFIEVSSNLLDAIKVFAESEINAQLVSSAYLVSLLLLFIAIGVDAIRLIKKESPVTVQNLEEKKLRTNRQTLMDKVKVKWIDGVLHKSLYQKARIELGLEERPEMLGLEGQNVGEERQELPKGSRLLSRFKELGAGGTLLVLGDPGAGKTTLLLELEADLLEATPADNLNSPLPVVLNLSSWGTYKLPNVKKLTLNDWLIEELYINYQVRREVSKSWLQSEQWILLLDGLDEVREVERASCIAAINQFRQDNGTFGMALCCRIGDFNALQTELKFQAAVYVQPLNQTQVAEYLEAAKLDGILQTVQQDMELKKLASNPLFLRILSLAYQNRSANELRNLSEPERLKLLFDRYIERMFQQRPTDKLKKKQMIRWLGIIAKKMGSEKEFLIERMQPRDWLKKKQIWSYESIVGLILALISGVLFAIVSKSIINIGVSILIAFVLANYYKLDEISTIDSLDYSKLINLVFKFVKESKYRLIKVLGYGFFFGLAYFIFRGWNNDLIYIIISGLFMGMTFEIIIKLISTLIFNMKKDINTTRTPNERVWRSLSIMSFATIVCASLMIFFYIGQSIIQTSFKPNDPLPFYLVLVVPVFYTFRFCGGEEIIKHFALRLVLYDNKLIPWNFAQFFQQAEDRLFIQRTGGSYIFIHRYLQEHFASLANF